MYRSIVLLILFSQFLVSCTEKQEDDDMNNENKVVTDQNLIKMLRSSPDQITLNGKNLSIETYFWRDFMPGSNNPDGSPLMGSIKFVGENADVLSKTISVSKVYVVNNDMTWVCKALEIRNENVLEAVVRGGPKWEPGIHVDVISEFTILKKSYRLIAKSQTIHVTY